MGFVMYVFFFNRLLSGFCELQVMFDHLGHTKN